MARRARIRMVTSGTSTRVEIMRITGKGFLPRTRLATRPRRNLLHRLRRTTHVSAKDYAQIGTTLNTSRKVSRRQIGIVLNNMLLRGIIMFPQMRPLFRLATRQQRHRRSRARRGRRGRHFRGLFRDRISTPPFHTPSTYDYSRDTTTTTSERTESTSLYEAESTLTDEASSKI